MTINSPELRHAKAVLGMSTLARGARERIYWRIVHKPARVGRGHWRVSMMIFGWLTAATAAYGLGRIVYSTLPVLSNEPSTLYSAQRSAGETTHRRAKRHAHPDVVTKGSITSATPISSASPPTASMSPATELSPPAHETNVTLATATPAPDSATTTRHAPVTTDSRSITRNDVGVPPLAQATNSGQLAPDVTRATTTSVVATGTSTSAAVPGRLVTDNAPVQESLNTLAAPIPAQENAPGSDDASDLGLQVTDYKQAVALLNDQPEAALERFYAHRRHWPSSAIAQEVDLRIIQSLLTLGRTDSARAAARSFLLHYPGSARTKEVSRIAEANH